MTTMAPIDGVCFIKRGIVELVKEGRNDNCRIIHLMLLEPA